jgi:hypothetical protein
LDESHPILLHYESLICYSEERTYSYVCDIAFREDVLIITMLTLNHPHWQQRHCFDYSYTHPPHLISTCFLCLSSTCVNDNSLLFIHSLLMKSLTLQERKWDVWKVVTSGFLNQKTNCTDVWVDRNIDCRKVLSYNFPPNSAHLALAQHAIPSQQRGHEAYVRECQCSQHRQRAGSQ